MVFNKNIDGCFGSLIVVGSGIQAAGQLTIEARNTISHADKVFYLVTDYLTECYLKKLNSSAESLHSCYETGKDRFLSYLEMVDRILGKVREENEVCAVFYGHPGVFAYPSHEAIRQARKEGFYARMLPGISAEDCLFADLGVDPASHGCQSYEATDFLIYKRIFDPCSSLVIWQVGVIGDLTFQASDYETSGIQVLVEHLQQAYGSDHVTIVYEAAQYPIFEPRIETVPLLDLPKVSLSSASTLYIPPKAPRKLDQQMLARLGIQEEQIHHIIGEIAVSNKIWQEYKVV